MIHFTYNFLIKLIELILPIVGLFNPKMKLFTDGRKNVLAFIQRKIDATQKNIWFHVASLGEYEQGLPLIHEIRKKYPNHKIILTFFSPSGYEIRKNTPHADVVCYLPLDTPENAKKFISTINPEMVFFIKYEYWPNYLMVLQQHKIPTYLISGIFKPNQVFFKWYGSFYRSCLKTFTHFFVQDSDSLKLLSSININNVTVSGDTRFDRVCEILQSPIDLNFVNDFKQDKLLVVVGSSWPKDEELLISFINHTNHNVKWIIAPHNIKNEQIESLQKSFTKRTILYSEKENQKIHKADVLILNTIGILTKVYSYADLAYVGGGFGSSGLHNVLEPAVFGIPVIIGPNYQKFNEAVALVNKGGCISVSNISTLTHALNQLIISESERVNKGNIASKFVQKNAGAVKKIMDTIEVI